MAWRLAIERRTGRRCSRSRGRRCRICAGTANGGAEGVLRGAYVVSEAQGGRPDAIIIATGSEVSLAVEAQTLLRERGVRARVVSMPCWELFEAAGPGVPRRGAAAGRPRARLGRGGRHARLAALGRRRRREHRHRRTLRRVGAGQDGAARTRLHGRERRGRALALVERLSGSEGVSDAHRNRRGSRRIPAEADGRSMSCAGSATTSSTRARTARGAGRLSGLRRGRRARGRCRAKRTAASCSAEAASVRRSRRCKIPGVRAAVCHDTYSAHQGVEHDDMNVLTLGARIVGPELALELVRAFVGRAVLGRRAARAAAEEGARDRGAAFTPARRRRSMANAAEANCTRSSGSRRGWTSSAATCCTTAVCSATSRRTGSAASPRTRRSSRRRSAPATTTTSRSRELVEQGRRAARHVRAASPCTDIRDAPRHPAAGVRRVGRQRRLRQHRGVAGQGVPHAATRSTKRSAGGRSSTGRTCSSRSPPRTRASRRSRSASPPASTSTSR